MEHELFFCGVFFTFWFYTLVDTVALSLGVALNLFIEAVFSACGGIFFILAALVAMILAEQDEHLMYLTDDEERNHPFFYLCKWQSILSLVTGFSFIRNFLLIMDILIIVEDGEDDDNVLEADRPLKLYEFVNTQRVRPVSWLSWCSLNKRTDRNIDQTI